MKCRIDVKKSIVKKAIAESETKNITRISESVLFVSNTAFPSGKAQAFRVAESVVNKTNRNFNGLVAHRREMTNGQEIVFSPSPELVTVYFNDYLKRFNEDEAMAIQREDAERAGIDYDDDYLFDSPGSENPLYNMYEDMDNLELTPEVIEYLYSDSSQRMSMIKFAQSAKDLISNLRGLNYTNDDILDKIKCL